MTRLLVALVLAMGCTQYTWAVETLRWERLPLTARLLVGQERVILIDRNVRVGVPAEAGEHLHVQSAGGALYLKADAPLPTTRLEIQDAQNGALILLDISAEPAAPDEAPLEPLRILDASRPKLAPQTGTASDAEASDISSAKATTPVAVALTRYAAQSLYAPLRTVTPVPGLTAVPLRRPRALDTLLPTLPLRAAPLAAWRLGNYWLTAVKLTNTSPRLVELDPRLLQGDFVAATFQHRTVGPAGDSSDTTVVYLITRGRGLAESLLPALAPIDAAINLPYPTEPRREE